MVTLPPQPTAGDDPFALSGLDALLTTAARSSPDTVLFADDTGYVTAAVLARRVRVLGERFRLAGLRRGERALIVAGAQVQTLVAIIAAVRAGLEPALARPGLGAVEMAAQASAAQAAALIGPTFYGEPVGETYLSTAALAETIRLIATHGVDPTDGALDISAAGLDASSDATTGEPPLEMPLIATFTGPVEAPRLVSHRQAALFADALSLVEQARINPSRAILSLLPPSSRAGLVVGPFAALVGASKLVLHGPFDAATLLGHLDSEPGVHLVVPAAAGGALSADAFTAALGSLILVSRFADTEAFAMPEPLTTPHAIADLYAFGEETVLAQRRLEGEARPPTRVADRSLTDGLGARLNRARAEHRLHMGDPQAGDLPTGDLQAGGLQAGELQAGELRAGQLQTGEGG